MTHHPRNPPKVFERVARMMLLRCDGAWWPPWHFGFKHGIEEGDELAHDGDQRDLDRLAGRAQARVIGAQHRIAAHRGDGLERLARLRYDEML